MPKVTGAPIYGMDISMPDMLYGIVLRPPRIDTTYKGCDASKAEDMPGVVKVIKEDDFVAVVAKSRYEAEKHAEIVDMTKVGEGESYLVQKEGSKVDGDDIIEVEYSTPAGAHAQLEPNGSVAQVQDDKAIVYISTQVPKTTLDEVCDFGRRLHTPTQCHASRPYFQSCRQARSRIF